jgi:uncharacterized protein YfaA (DUF2138 family)
MVPVKKLEGIGFSKLMPSFSIVYFSISRKEIKSFVNFHFDPSSSTEAVTLTCPYIHK